MTQQHGTGDKTRKEGDFASEIAKLLGIKTHNIMRKKVIFVVHVPL